MAQVDSALTEVGSNAHVSPKRRLVALLLCVFAGWLGAHRFYVGKIGTGLLWLFTAGCFLFGWAYDFLVIVSGNFKDTDGKRLTIW